MSDPEVPQPEKPTDVDGVVDSAKAGLADAEAAAAGAPSPKTDDAPDAAVTTADDFATADETAADAAAIDPDAAAFAEAEKSFPGTFATSADDVPDDHEPPTKVEYSATDGVATAAYGATATAAAAAAAETQVMPAEPVVDAPPPQPQPIFVQAPEPPRPLGNRGTAGAIGLLATLSFAILLLGVTLAIGAAGGDVTGDNIGDKALAPLTTWSFWTPVVVFFIAFWLLGAIINRGRWGHWVIWGLLVGVAAWAGHLLGQLFQEQFWTLTAQQGVDLMQDQLFAPLAIAAFIIGRELTIWFGAWVARAGARKTQLNIEAQREYERTLEAGPTLSR
ncbi:ABC transporter [Microbacterium bovistercoris]|uniref:ABC transporter n=1 Tax=Microbacterium bovistercoris TaxID=2293570 RepID=A0A371NXS2_9MICO|nr:ABC transporter [Microbacterium bovistercoris]REJ07895.1 ABC transporter [Microbacterium bovistercoris]